MKIGEKLKRLRQANSLTQEELANRAYLTKGFISQLERDQTSPSIATLKDILDVLGVSLADFFRDLPQDRVVYPQSARITTSNSTTACRVEVLVPDAQNRMMDPVLVTLAGGAALPPQEPHEGEEFGIVLKGAVSLRLDNSTFRVKQSECFYFRSDREHAVVNLGKQEVRILWVVTPPIFG
ncbi:helix-turn-helix domain-containing protein [Desulfobacca acetoxidans]|uniref:Cupin 2 conserved barrel domain protein n=1 Tax=Desulfobacca acetoxidans (strain ATCC 700848 / DSM 11109 / ASRB2) TaxID=880072 RepID=F2NHT5_DESAR|nr:XRE family transcriptional regulator [Desulfobacca acetoxidans]AEB09420.1 Cupin 2 conserved barrel domain protein [Desulfobacca acetoxidans DSM 11109]HAY20835.1 cupin domain-containing protein [Desulfobacterales bacterium]